MSFLRVTLFIVIVVGIFFIPRYLPSIFQKFKTHKDFYEIKMGSEIFKLEVADTEAKKVKGLSGREGLPENEGMIFIFDKPGNYGTWMREMLFPIDIIWLKNKQVVDVVEGVRPAVELEPHIYYPSSEADMLIEVNAGVVKNTGLSIGDHLVF